MANTISYFVNVLWQGLVSRQGEQGSVSLQTKQERGESVLKVGGWRISQPSTPYYYWCLKLCPQGLS